MGKLRHSKRDGSNSTGYGCSKGSTRMNNTGGLSRSSVALKVETQRWDLGTSLGLVRCLSMLEALGLIPQHPVNAAWWCLPVVPVLGRQKQEEQKFTRQVQDQSEPHETLSLYTCTHTISLPAEHKYHPFTTLGLDQGLTCALTHRRYFSVCPLYSSFPTWTLAVSHQQGKFWAGRAYLRSLKKGNLSRTLRGG